MGTDFDLHQLVDHEAQIETAAALDRLLSADRLAGKMGERIAAGSASFRGRAGEQLRRDYIAFVLNETDLSIHACEYGWCVFQAAAAADWRPMLPGEVPRSALTAPTSWWSRRTLHSGANAVSAMLRSCRRLLGSPVPHWMRRSLNVTEFSHGWRMIMSKTVAEGRRNRTARAYLAALDRLMAGKATHPDHVGRPVRITPAAVAKEARRGRNPLYTTHRALLTEIEAAASGSTTATDLAATVATLEARNAGLRRLIHQLKIDKRNLATENRSLLHRARVAEDRLNTRERQIVTVTLGRRNRSLQNGVTQAT